MTIPQKGDGVRPSPAINEPDAHGQAALLLAESMLHTLLARGVVTLEEAVSVVETAAEVKAEVATAAGESAERMQASLDLLERIASSFAADGKGDGWPTRT